MPTHLVVAFDLKAPTHRHKLYEGYKANRHGMPNELAMQMPILKDILTSMNITIIEKEGYEADDILGTLAKLGQKESFEVTILTGDRDSFQLIDEHIMVKIPRTKQGKTETQDYTLEKIKEEYGLTPKDLIEVKGLSGDTSDNIPGVSGVGEKTAINLIKEYKTIAGVYENIENIKGKLKEKLETDKEMALLSKTLGTIDVNAPIDTKLNQTQVVEWNKELVLEKFKKLKFNRFIERFNLLDIGTKENNVENKDLKYEYESLENNNKVDEIKQEIINTKKMFYYIDIDDIKINLMDRNIKTLNIFSPRNNKTYYTNNIEQFRIIFEDERILKCGYKQKEDWILLQNSNINANNLMFDIEIAGYLLNSNISKYTIEYLANEYLRF